MMWLFAASLLVILEMFTGTFYLLMIAAGLVAGGLVALVGGTVETQFAVAAVVGSIATYGLCRSKLGATMKNDVARDPNVNLDIGQRLTVDVWHGSAEPRTARIVYRGALWDVELEPDSDAIPGEFVIREVRGNRLIVSNSRTK